MLFLAFCTKMKYRNYRGDFMEWLVVLCLILSTINFYFLIKNLSKKSFDSDLIEFRTYTETLITEFNRITTRNVELLDSRIEDLNHKIRLSQKIDLLLKERFEEAAKIEYLKPLQMEQIYSSQTAKNPPPAQQNEIDHIITDDLTIEDVILDNLQYTIPTSEENPEIDDYNNTHNLDILTEILSEISEEDSIDIVIETPEEIPKKSPSEYSSNLLFEGIPVEKIKKHKKNSRVNLEKENQLIQYIKQNKNKDELLELGFTSNEINIAMLCYSTENPTI